MKVGLGLKFDVFWAWGGGGRGTTIYELYRYVPL